MGHYANVEDGVVTCVVVAEEDFLPALCDACPGDWVQTSYNTRGGVHVNGGRPLRKNYAGVGFTYNAVMDAFIPPQPYPSWILNVDTCLWGSPVEYPTDGNEYTWNELTCAWVLFVCTT